MSTLVTRTYNSTHAHPYLFSFVAWRHQGQISCAFLFYKLLSSCWRIFLLARVGGKTQPRAAGIYKSGVRQCSNTPQTWSHLECKNIQPNIAPRTVNLMASPHPVASLLVTTRNRYSERTHSEMRACFARPTGISPWLHGVLHDSPRHLLRTCISPVRCKCGQPGGYQLLLVLMPNVFMQIPQPKNSLTT